MPRNDRSDSLSVRDDDDPRKPLKALEQEAEVELGWSEATDTGGVEHQSRADREGAPRRDRPAEATAHATDARGSQATQPREPGGDDDASSAQHTRGEGPRVEKI